MSIFVGSEELSDVRSTHRFAAEFFQKYEQTNALALMNPWMQLVECLEGKGDSQMKLKGNFLNEDEITQNRDGVNSTKMDATQFRLVTGVFYARTFLNVVLGNNELAIEDQSFNVKEESSTWFLKSLNYFHIALAHLALARNCLDRKKHGKSCKKHDGKVFKHHRANARKYMRLLKRHNHAESPFLQAALSLIWAELHDLHKHKRRALHLYKDAILMFERQDFHMYKAIALERAGAFCIRVNDSSNAKSFMKQALDKYTALGVHAKIPLIDEMQKRASELPPSGGMEGQIKHKSGVLKSMTSLSFLLGKKQQHTKQIKMTIVREVSLGKGKDDTTSTAESPSIEISEFLSRKKHEDELFAGGDHGEPVLDEGLEYDMNSSCSCDMDPIRAQLCNT